ncbi:hypothetical protein QBC37DRAFT_459362, partial [Rhypophila decipiens]
MAPKKDKPEAPKPYIALVMRDVQKKIEADFLDRKRCLETLAVALDDGLSKIPDSSSWKLKFAVEIRASMESVATGTVTNSPTNFVATKDSPRQNHDAAQPSPTPTGPATLVQTQSAPPTWTDVVRRKRAAPVTDETPVGTPTRKGSPPKTRKDGRLFVRLGPEDGLRSITPEAVKIWVADITDMPMSKFTRCNHVNSGVSITCTDDLARTECLEKLRKKAITVDEAIDGVNYVISGVPSSIITHQGERDIKPLLRQEIEAATRCKVIRLASAKTEGTHFVTLPNEVRPFRIFGSKPARLARNRTEVWQCENCHGFHHTRACWGKTRCKCGLIP